MPLVKRKRITEVAPPDPLQYPPDTDVFYLQHTGEIFLDYESYIGRVTFYNQRIFQCELTGKQNLTYFEAIDSERSEASLLHRRFPEPLKAPILRSVQFQVTGRLDNLVEIVHDRFKDRFFDGESVFVDVQGDKYFARITKVFPPKNLLKNYNNLYPAPPTPAGPSHANGANGKGSPARKGKAPAVDGAYSDSSLSDVDDQLLSKRPASPEDVIHHIGTDLELELKVADKLDDPDAYFYNVQLVDDEGKFTGSIMEVKAKALSRDRLTFSKTIMKKYLRECVVRESAVGSPWIVRTSIAERYGIPTVPNQGTIDRNEEIKEQKLLKRKKIVGEDVPPRKSHKKKKPDLEAKRLEEEKRRAREEERERKEKEKALERERAERKRLIKYPIEDLEVDPASERELKAKIAGEVPRRRTRPNPSRELPVPKELLEPLLMTWSFLMSMGKPLQISPFTLDDYEAALRHSTRDPPCQLVSEIHGVLLNVIIRDGGHVKGLASTAAVAGRGAAAAAGAGEGEEWQTSASGGASRRSSVDGHAAESDDLVGAESRLLAAGRTAGSGWDRKVLKSSDHRKGWEAALVGCLTKCATVATMPRLMPILAHLSGTEPSSPIATATTAPAPTPSSSSTTPAEAYPTLAMGDKLSCILFLCELAVLTKPLKAYMEDCEAALTELRKERVEIGRERKRLADERATLDGRKKEPRQEGDGQGGGAAEDVDGDGEMKAEADASVDEELKAEVERENSSEGVGMDVGEAEASEEEDEEEEEKDELADSDDDEEYSNRPADSERGGNDSDGGSRDTPVDGILRRSTGASRQEKLRERALAREAQEAARAEERARQREAMRAKTAESKQLAEAKRKIDEEEHRLLKREEAIEREFRKNLAVPRHRPLGRDRFFNRYWWFDGVGAAGLLGQGGGVVYGTGRLFIQGPSMAEWEAMVAERGEEEVNERRRLEEGEDGILEPDEWAVYTDADDVEELISWLRVKGLRECAFKAQLLKFRPYIGPGMRKRMNDLSGPPQGDARRSARGKAVAAEAARQPYMQWRNTASRS